MRAIVEYGGGGKGERTVCGVRFLTVSVREGSRLSAALAAIWLERRGVRTAVFPEGYGFEAVFAKHGVVRQGTEGLYRAAAPDAVLCALRQLGAEPRCAHVALAGEEATGALRELALALCPRVRYLSLSAGRGGEALSLELMRRFGVSALAGARGADLTAAFGEAEAEGAVLRLGAEPAMEFDSPYPPRLLAALWEEGALKNDGLRVKNVFLTKCTKHL